MSPMESALWSVAFFLVVLWATTGLTLVHLGVLAARFVKRRLGPARAKRKETEAEPSGPVPTLTFVVPVYNDALTVGATVESLLRQTVRPDRILVVDDGSTDQTPQVLARFAGRGVDVLTMPKNGGKTRAIEAALAQVDTDLVAITDADSVVRHDYVKRVLRDFQRDPELAAVGGA